MKDKVYIITASSGIGAKTCLKLLANGSKVVFCGLQESDCKGFFEEISKLGFEADFLAGDLTIESFVTQLVDFVIKKHKRIDGLFNVAGISARKFGDGPLHECDFKAWETVLNNNLNTQFLVTKAVLNQMLQQEVGSDGTRGVILNMSSILGLSPEAVNFSAIGYAVSKGAIISLTKSAAAYYAKYKIRINAIAPGLTQTPMSSRAVQDSEILKFIQTKQPLMGDVLTPEQIADVAYFLLSENSRMITGQAITVDGGWEIS